MNKFDFLLNDFLRVTDGLSAFTGSFLYTPLGIETSGTVNTFTMAFAVGSLCYAVARYRQGRNLALLDRQMREFGLLRAGRPQPQPPRPSGQRIR